MQPEIDIGPLTLQTFGICFAARVPRRRGAGRQAAAGAGQARRLGLRDGVRGADRRARRRAARLHPRELRRGQRRPARQHLLRRRAWSGTAARSAARSASSCGPGGAGCWASRCWTSAAPPLALGYAIGRIGCQLSGDGDYGQAWDGPWAMAYPDGTVADRRPRSTRRRSTRRSRWARRLRAVAPARPLPHRASCSPSTSSSPGSSACWSSSSAATTTSSLGLTQAQLISVAMIAAGGVWLAVGRPPRRAARRGAGRAGAVRSGRAQQPAVERDHRAGQVRRALRAQEGDQVAVLLRRPSRPAGTPSRRARSISSSEPQLRASRSVAKRPVATVLTVIPSAATSAASVLKQPDRRHPVGVRQRQARDRLADRARADVDDPPPAALPHPRQHRLDQHPRRQHQRAVGRLPLLARVVERAARAAGRRCW